MVNLRTLTQALFISTILIFVGCEKDLTVPAGDVGIAYFLNGEITTSLNPTGIAPLTAIGNMELDKVCKMDLLIDGQHPVEKTFYFGGGEQSFDILGLFPDSVNFISLRFYDEAGHYANHVIEVETQALPIDLPNIEINTLNKTLMEPGFHLADVHLANFGGFNTQIIAFDNQGHIRWYLDLSEKGEILWPFERYSNGNFLVTDHNTIFEFDMMGREVVKIDIPGFTMHHDILELPNGNYLAVADNPDAWITDRNGFIKSSEDHIIEVDRSSGDIVHVWDLRQILDVDRHDVAYGNDGDWFHMNALWYSEADDCIVVSGRNQGVIKVNRNNELVWILAAHQGWGDSGKDGEGEDTRPFLLTAIDDSGTPFHDSIQYGVWESDEFDWAWGQHSAEYLPNGNLFLFDNGVNRNFGNAAFPFSRGVEYEIDETNKTVKQVWAYGKERFAELFSFIISDVDYLPESGNRLITSGFIRNPGTPPHAKIVEVDQNKNVVFESTLWVKDFNSDGTFAWGQIDIVYRSERLSMYP